MQVKFINAVNREVDITAGGHVLPLKPLTVLYCTSLHVCRNKERNCFKCLYFSLQATETYETFKNPFLLTVGDYEYAVSFPKGTRNTITIVQNETELGAIPVNQVCFKPIS